MSVQVFRNIWTGGTFFLQLYSLQIQRDSSIFTQSVWYLSRIRRSTKAQFCQKATNQCFNTTASARTQHNTGLLLNGYRTKPKPVIIRHTTSAHTHTGNYRQSLLTCTCTQSANTTQSQPAQKGQYITVLY